MHRIPRQIMENNRGLKGWIIRKIRFKFCSRSIPFISRSRITRAISREEWRAIRNARWVANARSYLDSRTAVQGDKSLSIPEEGRLIPRHFVEYKGRGETSLSSSTSRTKIRSLERSLNAWEVEVKGYRGLFSNFVRLRAPNFCFSWL